MALSLVHLQWIRFEEPIRLAHYDVSHQGDLRMRLIGLLLVELGHKQNVEVWIRQGCSVYILFMRLS